MRQDYARFAEREAEILCVAPDDAADLHRYWEKENFLFPGLADPDHTVADQYAQEVNLLKMGRMPAILVIDREGVIRYRHAADSMRDYPDNKKLLRIVELLNEAADVGTTA